MPSPIDEQPSVAVASVHDVNVMVYVNSPKFEADESSSPAEMVHASVSAVAVTPTKHAPASKAGGSFTFRTDTTILSGVVIGVGDVESVARRLMVYSLVAS
jgi:hypothetical protein